jgi:molybdopterin molybdotransferase
MEGHGAEAMLSVDDARARVLSAVEPLEVISMALMEARGYAVASDVFAPHDLPRFANSAMDGFAVRSSDASRASDKEPVRLRIAGEVRAGDPGKIEVSPGTAVRIMTGAPVPPGGDAVVPVEEIEERGDDLTVTTPAPAGRNVRPAGDDLETGELLVRGGTELEAGELALLASMGVSPVEVHRRPRVAVLVTGDELVSPESDPAPGQIRDSNSVALAALVAAAGAQVVLLERVPDELPAVRESFEQAAAHADLVVSSGGVAVGKYDFVKAVVEELGRIELWRVAMQPGKPVVLGALKDAPFLGLPGNPVSIHVGFEQFVRPSIRKMRGCAELLRPTVRAVLTSAIEKRPGRMHFVRVVLEARAEGWTATPTGPQGSHIQSSLIGCHGVARFPRDETQLAAGEEVIVEVWRLPGPEQPPEAPGT